MPDLLLELYSEEIPARMQAAAAGQLKKRLTDSLVEAGISYEGAREYWTPRRLVLDVRGLAPRSADLSEERKGPRTDAPQKALEGFMRGAGLASLDEALIRSDPKKGDFYVAVISRPGRDAKEILAETIPAIIRDFNWPKSMRWGAASADSGSLRWVRPLKSVLCLFGAETEETQIIPFSIDGITASDITYGHRFMAPEPMKVRRFDDYTAALASAKVMLDGDHRMQTILGEARNLAFAMGLELVEDEGLLHETANLVEWPVVLSGEFDEAFLDLPDQVIRHTIRENQKCFVMRGKDGRLVNRFVLVSNIEAADGGREISRGNARVVNARLSDARFFWQTDLQTVRGSDGFAPWVEGLSSVTFHARLGTQLQRVERIEALARELAQHTGADPAVAGRAARIAKADLQSQMVFEFPQLQGYMGRLYASEAGEEEDVARAVEDHYKPLGPGDQVPANPVTSAVALADKLDLLTAFWAIDERPTGSKDPFALRRAALGVVRLVSENGIRLPLARIIRQAYSLIKAQQTDLAHDEEKVVADLISFFHDRLTVWLREQSIRHDVIEAVLAPGARAPGSDGNDDILIVVQKVRALQDFLSTDEGRDLISGYKRAANIVAAERRKAGESAGGVRDDLLVVEEERQLHEALNRIEGQLPDVLAQEDFKSAMTLLAELRAPIDRFFEEVLVNAQDEQIRDNRLALLSRIASATLLVADLSSIEGQ